MSVDLVERNYILWERLAQPRRARARLFALEEPRLCAVHRVEFERSAPALGPATTVTDRSDVNRR